MAKGDKGSSRRRTCRFVLFCCFWPCSESELGVRFSRCWVSRPKPSETPAVPSQAAPPNGRGRSGWAPRLLALVGFIISAAARLGEAGSRVPTERVGPNISSTRVSISEPQQREGDQPFLYLLWLFFFFISLFGSLRLPDFSGGIPNCQHGYHPLCTAVIGRPELGQDGYSQDRRAVGHTPSCHSRFFT